MFKINHRLQYLFDLNQQVRIYLRFIIESFAIIAIYLLWLVNIGGWGQFIAATHLFNGVIWVLAYIVLGLHKDRLRFSSLKSYLRIIKISLFIGLLLAVESFLLMGSLDIVAALFVVLASLNIIVGLRVTARQFIREMPFKTGNILVYGTSDVAIDLVNAMAFGKKYNVVGFISENPQNIGSLAGLQSFNLRM